MLSLRVQMYSTDANSKEHLTLLLSPTICQELPVVEDARVPRNNTHP
jgi:hypothetical protein